jgi:hypothetical protein
MITPAFHSPRTLDDIKQYMLALDESEADFAVRCAG